MTDSTPGWQPDPRDRHEHRWWDDLDGCDASLAELATTDG